MALLPGTAAEAAAPHSVPSPAAPSGAARLGADEEALLASFLHLGDLLCFSLTCRAFDNARRRLGHPLRTPRAHFAQSLPLMHWAIANLGWLDDALLRGGCEWAAKAPPPEPQPGEMTVGSRLRRCGEVTTHQQIRERVIAPSCG